MDLSQYISKLLETHDCVIIPEFGGFIGNYKPAVIDEQQGLIYPPSKSLLFNENLKTNDGLLGNEVVKKEGLSYNDSLDLIHETVSEWRSTLKEGGRVSLGELGFLYGQNDKVLFEQSREVNLLLSAYGLAPVKLVKRAKEVERKPEPVISVERPKVNKPIVAKKQEKVTEPVVHIAKKEIRKEEKELTTEKETVVVAIDPIKKQKADKESVAVDTTVIPLPKRKRRALKIVAVAAMLPLAFYSVWIPAKTDFLDTGSIQLSDFNPLRKSVERVYDTRDTDFKVAAADDWTSWDELIDNLSDNVKVYNYQFDEELYIPVKLNNSADILGVNESTEVVNSSETNEGVSVNESAGPYHLITGCFSIESNAVKLVDDLKSKGFSARILDKNKGLYRVTAGDYTKRSSAKSAKSSLENQGISNWILKK